MNTLPDDDADADQSGAAEHRFALIRDAAYRRFQARGGEHGHDRQDWLDAEAEVDAADAEVGSYSGLNGEAFGSAAAPMNLGDDAPAGKPGTGEAICPVCGGSGRIGGTGCIACRGTGRITVGIG